MKESFSDELPNKDGRHWLYLFLEAQAKVQFQMLWLTFAIGQTGAAGEFGPPGVATEMLDQMEEDIADLSEACAEAIEVARSILANGRANAKRKEASR